MFVVEGVAQRIERPLPARRRNIEAPPGLQVAPGGEDMDVSASALLTVQDGRPGVSVGLQPRPRRLLELVEHSFDLFVGGVVLRCPGDYAGGVPVLEVERVGHRSHHVRVPAQHLNAFARLPGRVPLPEEVAGRLAGRAGPVR